MSAAAPPRKHSLQEAFNGVRWLKAGVFEASVADVRALLRLAVGGQPQPF